MGHYPANNLIRRSLILRHKFERQIIPGYVSYQILTTVSRGYVWPKGRLATCYWAVRFPLNSEEPKERTCMSNCKSESRNLQQDQLDLNFIDYLKNLKNLKIISAHSENKYQNTSHNLATSHGLLIFKLLPTTKSLVPTINCESFLLLLLMVENYN